MSFQRVQEQQLRRPGGDHPGAEGDCEVGGWPRPDPAPSGPPAELPLPAGQPAEEDRHHAVPPVRRPDTAVVDGRTASTCWSAR